MPSGSFPFPRRWQGQEHGPNPLSEAAARRCAGAGDVLDLTVSNPTTVGLVFPEDWPRLLTGAAAADVAEGAVSALAPLAHYAPDAQGMPSARRAVADYYAGRGESVDPEDLFLTAGTSEAYAHLFRILCEPGDAVLAPRPSYPLLETLADLAGLELRHYPLALSAPSAPSTPEDRIAPAAWRLDRDALAAQITERTRVLCVVQPNNPTGNLLAPEEAAWLLDLAARRNLALLVDEVFADHTLDGSIVPLLRTQGPLVFTLNGLSKLVALPQLKLAWIHAAGNPSDKNRAKELLEWVCDAHLSVGAAPQLAAPELLRRRTEFQGPVRDRVAANLAVLREAAAKNPRLEPLWPRGGWCIPLRCAGIEDDERFAIRLVEEQGVLTQPGYFFDFEDEEILVVSLLTEPKVFREGLARLVRLLATRP